MLEIQSASGLPSWCKATRPISPFLSLFPAGFGDLFSDLLIYEFIIPPAAPSQCSESSLARLIFEMFSQGLILSPS